MFSQQTGEEKGNTPQKKNLLGASAIVEITGKISRLVHAVLIILNRNLDVWSHNDHFTPFSTLLIYKSIPQVNHNYSL